MKKVVFLYSYRPSGHARAAQALAKAFREAGAAETVEIEVAGELNPVLGPAVSRAYLELVKRTPGLWDAVYDHAGLARATKELRGLFHFLQGLGLAERILAHRPDLVVATHALPCGSAAALKRRGELACPLAAVPTDYSVHRYWLDPAVDLTLAPSQEEERRLLLPPGRSLASGIPVDPAFSRLPGAAEARRSLGLRPDAPTALLTGGSRGLGPLLEELETLCEASQGLQLILLCGNNADLFERARRGFGRDPRVRVLGFTEDTAPAVAAADVVVGKAGGLTLAEALAAGVPPLIFEPLPGQERRNADFLVARGAAWRAEGLADLRAKLKVLLSRGEEWRALRENGGRMARPDAAEKGRLALEGLLALVPGA